MRTANPRFKQTALTCRVLLSATVIVVGVLGMALSSSHVMAQPTSGVGLNASAGPGWSELSSAQKAALKPLAGSWSGISEAQKRKWIALSQNYPSLPPAEQAKLHSRMDTWASLSITQRNQARLNFAETKQLSPDQKQSKWAAYQALTPQEKQKLATGSPATPAGAAIAITPVPKQKLADVPPSRSDLKGQQLSRSQKSGKNTNALALMDQPPLLPLHQQP